MCVLPLQIRLSGNGALEENGCAHLPPAEHPQAGPHGAPRGCYALAKRVSSAKSVKDSKAVCIETWFYITTPSLRSFRYVLVATPIAPLHLPPCAMSQPEGRACRHLQRCVYARVSRETRCVTEKWTPTGCAAAALRASPPPSPPPLPGAASIHIVLPPRAPAASPSRCCWSLRAWP